MPRKALITGATGFVGSHLVRRLADDGWSVDALVRRDDADLPSGVRARRDP
jgi:nucleoside-diphosphate-sugar epimerase